jgi:hypothetical protein
MRFHVPNEARCQAALQPVVPLTCDYVPFLVFQLKVKSRRKPNIPDCFGGNPGELGGNDPTALWDKRGAARLEKLADSESQKSRLWERDLHAA